MFKDMTLQLQPNPKQPKMRRRHAPNNQESADMEDQDMADPPSVPVLRLLSTMAQLVIRHDQEIQNLRRMDQFMLFLNQEPKGALHLLLEESKQWKQLQENASSSQMTPLRQHLMQALVKQLRSRAGQIVESQDTDPSLPSRWRRG